MKMDKSIDYFLFPEYKIVKKNRISYVWFSDFDKEFSAVYVKTDDNEIFFVAKFDSKDDARDYIKSIYTVLT